MNHLAADLWISTRRCSLFSDVTNRSGISALNTALQMKTAVLTSMENYFLFQFASARLSLLFKSHSCPLFLSSHVVCFLFLSAEASFLFKFCSLLDDFNQPPWQRATQIWPWQYLAFCCHGAEAVSVVWATCAGAHGSLINVMYRRNRSGEQEVLAKKKIDRAPLVFGMPCCIKSCLRTLTQTHTCTLVQMCMQPCIQIRWHLPTLMLVNR